MKKNVIFGMLVILLAFGFIGCGDGDGDSENIQLPYIGEWVANHPSLDINAPDYMIISLNNDNTFVYQEEKDSIKYNVLKGTFSVLNNIITMIITHGWTGGVDAHWDNSEQIMNNIKAYHAPDLLIIGQLNENTLILGEGEQQTIFSKKIIN